MKIFILFTLLVNFASSGSPSVKGKMQQKPMKFSELMWENKFLKFSDITVSYTVENGEETYSINVSVPEGSVFLTVMERAAELDERFAFECKFFESLGCFVEAIGGVWNIPDDEIYWMFYIYDELSPLGVSSLVVLNGFEYTFSLEYTGNPSVSHT